MERVKIGLFGIVGLFLLFIGFSNKENYIDNYTDSESKIIEEHVKDYGCRDGAKTKEIWIQFSDKVYFASTRLIDSEEPCLLLARLINFNSFAKAKVFKSRLVTLKVGNQQLFQKSDWLNHQKYSSKLLMVLGLSLIHI